MMKGYRSSRMKAELREWLSIKSASVYCDISIRTLRDWLKRGLKHARVGGKLLIKRSWLDSYIEAFVEDNNEVDRIVDSVMRDFQL